MLGKWTGTYKYLSQRLPEKVRNNEVKFDIEIIEFDCIRFSGLVKDDIETGGMKGTGKIEGHVKNGIIKFVKAMPTQSVYLQDGSNIEEDKPHRNIYYSGKISDNTIKGTWKFKWGIGKVKNRWVIFPGTKGTFEMKKAIN